MANTSKNWDCNLINGFELNCKNFSLNSADVLFLRDAISQRDKWGVGAARENKSPSPFRSVCARTKQPKNNAAS